MRPGSLANGRRRPAWGARTRRGSGRPARSGRWRQAGLGRELDAAEDAGVAGERPAAERGVDRLAARPSSSKPPRVRAATGSSRALEQRGRRRPRRARRCRRRASRPRRRARSCGSRSGAASGKRTKSTLVPPGRELGVVAQRGAERARPARRRATRGQRSTKWGTPTVTNQPGRARAADRRAPRARQLVGCRQLERDRRSAPAARGARTGRRRSRSGTGLVAQPRSKREPRGAARAVDAQRGRAGRRRSSSASRTAAGRRRGAG